MKKVEMLGKAQIVVYTKGKKTVLDPRSPYFGDLQLACEDLIRHSFSKLVTSDAIKNWPSPGAVKNKEWAIELVYERPVPQRELGFAREITRLLSVCQFVIPLTGHLTSIKSDEGPYTAIFPFEKIVHRGGRTETIDWVSTNSCQVGTRKRLTKTATLLKRFGIDVPLKPSLDQKASNRTR